MTLGDFSSLVQLGVGLHAGTALFQLFSEFGVGPVEQRITRLAQHLARKRGKGPEAAREKVKNLKSSITIFKAQASNEYKKYVAFNLAIALLLLIVLVGISFSYNTQICWIVAGLVAAISSIPALVSLRLYWRRASESLSPIKQQLEEVEGTIFPRVTPKRG